MERWRSGLSETDRQRLNDPNWRVEVVGHASRAGDSASNRALSAERANTAARWLADHGVRAEVSGGGGGEHEARARGHADGSNDPSDRAVTIHIVPTDRAGEQAALRPDQVGFARGDATPPEARLREFYEANRERLEDPNQHLELVGHASRLGSTDANDRLAAERASNVAQWLIDHGARASITGGGMGEADARARGHADGTDLATDRTVTLRFAEARPEAERAARPERTEPSRRGDSPDRPREQRPPTPRAEDGARGSERRDTPAERDTVRNLPQFDREPLRTDTADRINQILDVQGALVGSVTLFVSSWAAELTGLALGAASPILGLGVAWLRGDDLAEWNGQIVGFTNAIEDMSRAYADPRLDTTPLNSWPPLPRPSARLSDDYLNNESGRALRRGEQAGAERAYQWVRNYRETVNVRGQDGQQHQVQMNPYLFLRGLAMAHPGRGEVARAVQNELNRQITARGGQPWPRLR